MFVRQLGLIAVIMAVCIFNGYAQSGDDDRQVVGVAKFTGGENSPYTGLVTEKVVEMLTNSKRFRVVDRTSRDKIVEELELQKNEAFIDSENLVEQGVAVAAEKIITGEIVKIPVYRMKNGDGSVRGFKASVAFQMKVVDVATGVSTEATSFEGKASEECLSPEAAVTMAMMSLEDEIAEYFRINFPVTAKLMKILEEKDGSAKVILVKAGKRDGVKKGDKFKKGEILRYNPQYFEPDPDMKRQVAYKHGYIGRVALVENNYTFEDSNGISKSLSSKLEIRPVITKMITIPTTVVIHKFAKVGDLVEHNTPLVTFELADTTDISGIGVDDSAMEYLESLNRTSPKAKTSGEIVSIHVLYASDLKDMSRTVRKMVDEYTKEKTAIGEYAEGSANNYLYPKSAQVPENSKYKGVNIDKETLILTYYIREAFDQNTGDKVVLDSSLKSVTCQVFEHAPVTESGKPIDVVFSVLCISKRIVNSPIISGMCETVLQTLEDKVIDIYFNGASTRGTNNHAAATSTEAFSVIPNEKNISVMSYFKSDEDRKLAVKWLKEFNEDDEADFDEKNAYPVGFYLKNKDMTETLIGYGLWNILAGYNNHPQIFNFYIGSEYRDSGCGTIAYEKFLSFIKTKGYKYLTIGAKSDNRKANHIYAKHNGQLASKFSLFDLRRIPKKNLDKEEGIVKIVTLKCDSAEHKKYETQLDRIRLEYIVDDGMAELKTGWKPVYLNESIIGLDKHGNVLAYCGKSQSTIFNPIAFTAEDMEIFVSHIARVIYRNDYKYAYDDTMNMCYNPGIIYPIKGRFASIFDKLTMPLTNIYLVKL